jgi:predicted homoserine dehydrogenase-like protein
VSDINRADPKRSGTYRAAMAAVIILSTLLALALIGLVAGLVRQYRLYQGDQPASVGEAVRVTLAPGARIVSAGTESGKLVLHVETPQGSEVEIFDLATGKLTAQVKDGSK